MSTRIVEGQLPYSGGTGIGIDTNKVISILLREENNLIEVNGDNELYTDLQLAVNITPSSDFPVGVTVGKVLAGNGWSQNGLILNWKTTSGDYARWLYGADGKLYFDGGQGTWKQVYYSEEVDALFTALRGELATVAFSGDYNDLTNRPAFLQLQADWEQTDADAPDYIKNKPTIPTVNDATLTIQKNGVAVSTFTANSSTNATANITVPNVINNLTSTSTSDALSAYQGKELQDQIDNLKAMGRFLSLWDCSTGMPISFPLDIPYNYQTGDYFLVETIDATTNYRPSGVQYTGTASSTTETDEVEIGDMYIYDGQVWLLQINHGKSVSFANLSGQPSDNANLATALNAKANSADLATVATSGSYNDLTNKPTIPSAQVNSDWNANSGVAQILNKPTIPTATSQLNNDSGYITSSYHDSTKQDTLSTQTAYTNKGGATKVPQISTNTLGQVTGITEVDITVGDSIEYKTQAEYNALLPGALTDNKHYFIYSTSGGGGWQPGVNTVAYYPLEANTNDATGNYNLTPTDITYTTITSGLSVATFNGSSSKAETSSFTTATGDYTTSVWVYGDDIQSTLAVIRGNAISDSDGRLRDVYLQSGEIRALIQPSGYLPTNNNYYQNHTWYNIVVSSGSAGVSLYINNNLITTQNITCNNHSNMYIGYRQYSNDRFWKGHISRLIIEDKSWDATEIGDYYNQTKGDYGIS